MTFNTLLQYFTVKLLWDDVHCEKQYINNFHLWYYITQLSEIQFATKLTKKLKMLIEVANKYIKALFLN